ncbi:MAG: plastocyanin/azurin family copper-binding protein [Verrucomicrobium sp.]
MATQHESHEGGSAFWSVANIILGLAFGVFSLVAGGSLIFGGIKNIFWKADPAHVVAAAPAAAAPAAAAPAVAPASDASGATVVTIKPGAANPMSFDHTTFSVKAGKPVKLTFNNDSATPLQHNLVIGKPGSKEKLMAAANGMMTDMAKWMAAGFIPDVPEVLAHTKLLNPKESQTIEFTAPEEKGECPYLCTFPGHAMIMQGTMKVE